VPVHLTSFVLRSRPRTRLRPLAGRRLPLRAHVEQVDEEVVGQRLRPLGEDAVLGLPGIGARARAGRRREPSSPAPSASAIAPDRPAAPRPMKALLAADIVAEAVGLRLERREGFDVGLLLRRVHAPRRERNLHVVRRPSRPSRSPRSRRERSGRRARPSCRRTASVELLLDRFELRSTFASWPAG
jgi:hypothetical protein